MARYEKAGAIIKVIRAELKLSQEGLAEVMNVHVSTVVRWEQGDTPMNAPQLSALCFMITEYLQERLMRAYADALDAPAANNNGNYDNLALDAMIIP